MLNFAKLLSILPPPPMRLKVRALEKVIKRNFTAQFRVFLIMTFMNEGIFPKFAD